MRIAGELVGNPELVASISCLGISGEPGLGCRPPGMRASSPTDSGLLCSAECVWEGSRAEDETVASGVVEEDAPVWVLNPSKLAMPPKIPANGLEISALSSRCGCWEALVGGADEGTLGEGTDWAG